MEGEATSVVVHGNRELTLAAEVIAQEKKEHFAQEATLGSLSVVRKM